MDFLLYFMLLVIGAIIGFVFALYQIGKNTYLIECQAWQRGFNHAIEIFNNRHKEMETFTDQRRASPDLPDL